MSRRHTSAAAILILLAIGALGTAIAASRVNATPAGFAFGALALVFVVAGVWSANLDMEIPVRLRALTIVAAALLAGFFWLLFQEPSYLFIPRRVHVPLLGAAVPLAGLALTGWTRSRRWSVAGLLVIYVALGVCIIVAAPTPAIDVWAWHREALDALFAGRNPYAMTMPNIYGAAASQNYAPDLVAGDRVLMGFQYPPLSLFLAIPGYLLGDYRYSLLIASVLSGVVLYLSRPGPLGAIAMALWLFSPGAFFVLQYGWTDSFPVLFLTMTAFAASRQSRWLFVPLGLLFAVKQYAVLAAPLVLLLPAFEGGATGRGQIRLLLKAGAVGAAVTAPMFLLNPAAMIRDLITFQVLQPFRPDSLSVPGWWHQVTQGGSLPIWLCFVAIVPALAVALWRCRVTTFAFPLATAFVLMVFFAFGKQAFVNYYHFVLGALVTAFIFAVDDAHNRRARRGRRDRVPPPRTRK
jgi:hypothetical protein